MSEPIEQMLKNIQKELKRIQTALPGFNRNSTLDFTIVQAAVDWYNADQSNIDDRCKNLSDAVRARFGDGLPLRNADVEAKPACGMDLTGMPICRLYRIEDIKPGDTVTYQDFGVAIQDSTKLKKIEVLNISHGWIYSVSDIKDPMLGIRGVRWDAPLGTTARVWHLIDRPAVENINEADACPFEAKSINDIKPGDHVSFVDTYRSGPKVSEREVFIVESVTKGWVTSVGGAVYTFDPPYGGVESRKWTVHYRLVVSQLEEDVTYPIIARSIEDIKPGDTVSIKDIYQETPDDDPIEYPPLEFLVRDAGGQWVVNIAGIAHSFGPPTPTITSREWTIKSRPSN